MKFIQDPLNPNSFELYDPNTGEIRKASQRECEGLERSAVWSADHVESRINDHFAGNNNMWVEQMKMILPE